MSRSYRRKPWYKPDKEFKRTAKRQRKAKEKQVLKDGFLKEFPIFKKTDVWEWN